MTTNQLLQLNVDLEPIVKGDIYSDNELRNNLVLFYYKCKYNYQRNQNNYNICDIYANWDKIIPVAAIYTPSIRYTNRIPSKLAATFYKFILNNFNINSGFIKELKNALDADKVLKNKAICYFNNKYCCINKSINNYNQYYFLQSNKFIGNR